MVLYFLSLFLLFFHAESGPPIESPSTPPPRISEYWKLLHLNSSLQWRIESQLSNYYDWNKAHDNCRHKSRTVIVKYSVCVCVWICERATIVLTTTTRTSQLIVVLSFFYRVWTKEKCNSKLVFSTPWTISLPMNTDTWTNENIRTARKRT